MRTRIMAAVAALLGTVVLMAPPAQAEEVPPDTVVAFEEVVVDPLTKPVKVSNGRTVTGQRVGGDCTGSTNYVRITKTGYNVAGIALMATRLTTNWCYTGRVVTAAWSSRSSWVTTFGAIGGWYFDKYNDFTEEFYSYNGRWHGGVATRSEAYFRQCPFSEGCIGSRTIAARTYVHYDGTANAY